jgi:hypothetical protein
MAIDWSTKKAPAWFEHNIPKRYPLPRLSDEDLIQMVTDIEEVRDLMSLRSYYQAADKRQEELDELWVSEPMHAAKASIGSNYGYYYGKAEIQRWYVDEFKAKRQAQLKVYCEKQGIPEDESLLGAGCMFMQPLSTSLVRIAKDGKSAKGIWYTIGQQSDLKEDGTASGLWVYAKVCADFIKENGKFKIYHVVVANDQNYQAGTQYSAPTDIDPKDDALAVEFGNPTIPMNVHDNTYNWADNYPPMPEPYDTLTPELSYGPEGHPMLKGGASV